MLADASTMIEAGRGLMLSAAIAHDGGNPNTKLASMAKCFCSDAAMKTVKAGNTLKKTRREPSK